MGKLGADGGIGDHIPKPKWMRWPTYDRKLEEVFAAEEVVERLHAGFRPQAHEAGPHQERMISSPPAIHIPVSKLI
jgi:hypothetical protein